MSSSLLQVCSGWDSSLWAEDMDSGIGHSMNFRDELDLRSFESSSPVGRRNLSRFNRTRGALNRSCSVPDSNNPPSLSPTSCGDISIAVTNLSQIGEDETDQPCSKSSRRLDRFNRGSSCECYTVSTIEDYINSTMGTHNSEESLNEPLHIEEVNEVRTEEEREEKAEDLPSPCNSCQDLEMERNSSGNSLNNGLSANNHMTKSMLCLNEESQDEVSLV